MAIIQFNPDDFDTAQSSLKKVIADLESLAEQLSNSADALIGSIEGPKAAFESCKSFLTLYLGAASFDLLGMSAELSASLSKMMQTDQEIAQSFEETGEVATGGN